MSSPDYGQNPKFEMNARHSCGAGLLLFDLDDTIVQSGSFVSERVMAALRAAHDAGYMLSIASGRPLCIVSKPILESGVMDYALCSNGASVVRLGEGATRLVVYRPLSREDALDCYWLLASFSPAWNASFDGKAFFELRGASYMLTGRNGAAARAGRYEGLGMGFIRRLVHFAKRGMRYMVRLTLGGGTRQVVSVRRRLERAHMGVEKMGCTILDEGECSRAVELLRSDGRYEVVRMSARELEITARGVTKGTGACALLEELGIDKQHAVAFGDSGNDLPLASAVGRFVAMGNADDEVKTAAFEVCPSVGEDGVAVWIENMLASGGIEEGTRYV